MDSSNSETVSEPINSYGLPGFSLTSLSSIDILILITFFGFLAFFLISRRKSKAEEENISENFTLLKSPARLTTQSSLSGGFIEKMVKGGKNVVVFYGSQTGTAEDFANRLAKEAIRYGLKGMAADPEECDMEELLNLKSIENSLAIFCMATYGEGDPTDNAQEFYNWLQNATVNMNGLRYTVFGLGNKTYENFNAMGKYFDRRLTELGATRIHELGVGDDDSNIEDHFITWKEDMWMSVCNHFGISGDKIDINVRQYRLDLPANVPENKIYKGEVTRLGAFEKQRPPFDAKNPFLAKVLVKQDLCKGGDRSVMHIELDITNSRIKYESGDHVAVFPTNDPLQVDKLAKRLDINLDQVISMIAIDEDNSKRHPFPCPTTYRTALLHYIDINNPLKTNVLGDLSEYASDKTEADFLKNLSSIEGKIKYQEWILDSRRNILAVLEDLPSLKVPIDHLLELLPRLQVRYYSISSSPKLYPNTIHITAVLLDYVTNTGRNMKGVCTHYLNMKNPSPSETPVVPIYVRRSQFRLPYKSKSPIIMVGPGSGIAPFKGFIEERSVAKSAGKPLGETVLYFGCRKQSEDFLYEDELKKAHQDNVVSDLYLAFSRDQSEKIYVQHLMNKEKNRKQIWDIINGGGHFYICGDAKHMAKDVNNTLLNIFQMEGGMTNGQAQDYLKMMQNKGRHSSDVWS